MEPSTSFFVLAIKFVNSVQAQFQHNDDDSVYEKYLDFMNDYFEGRTSQVELCDRVTDLLEGHRDLLSAFQAFVDHSQTLVYHRRLTLFKKIQAILSPEAYTDRFLKNFHRYSKGEIDGWQLERYIADIFKEYRASSAVSGDPKKEEEFDDLVKVFNVFAEDLYSISNNPSYRVPKDKECFAPAGRSRELEHQVLNNTVKCENPDFKYVEKKLSPDEIFWNQFEDDISEMDVMISTLSFAARRAEELLQKIHSLQMIQPDSKKRIRIEKHLIAEHLIAADLRCIETLYPKCGTEMVRCLRKYPGDVLTVVVPRLKQKLKEAEEKRVAGLFTFKNYFEKNIKVERYN